MPPELPPDNFMPLSPGELENIATEVGDMVATPDNLAQFRTHISICRLMELEWEEWCETVHRREQARYKRIWDWYADQIEEIRNDPEEQERRKPIWDEYVKQKAKWDTDPKLRNSKAKPPLPAYEWREFIVPDVYALDDRHSVFGYVVVHNKRDFAAARIPPEPPRPFRCKQRYGEDFMSRSVQVPDARHLLHGCYWVLAIIHDHKRPDEPHIIHDYDLTKKKQAEPWPESMMSDVAAREFPKGHRFYACYVRYALRAVRADLDRIGAGTVAQPEALNQDGNGGQGEQRVKEPRAETVSSEKEYVFRAGSKHGLQWTLRFEGGEPAHFRHLDGLAYIQHLLKHAGDKFSGFQLTLAMRGSPGHKTTDPENDFAKKKQEAEDGTSASGKGVRVDDKSDSGTLRDAEERFRELQIEKKRAIAENNPTAAKTADDEIKQLASYVGSVTGIGGKIREFPTVSGEADDRVRKAIGKVRTAIKESAETHKDDTIQHLATHIQNCIHHKAGEFWYEPAPYIPWQF